MTPISLLDWMWQSTICLGACWLLYYALLRREPCLAYNRGFLLLTPLLSAVLPLLPWGAWWSATTALPRITEPAVVPVPAVVAETTPLSAPAAALDWVLLLYVAGVVVFVGRTLWFYGRLWLLARRFPIAWQIDYTLRLTGGQLPTGSFIGTVFWDETDLLDAEEMNQVLIHEQAHVRQGHTAEQLGLLLCQALLWFNPVMVLYNRALTLTHEYLADAAVLAEAPAATTATYTRLLARCASRQWLNSGLVPAFTTSPVLSRIAMLHRPTDTRSWRQWAVLPITGLILTLMACQQQDTITPQQEPKLVELEQMPEYTGNRPDHLDHSLVGAVLMGFHLPAAAESAKVKGEIQVGITVAADGQMQNVRVLSSAFAPKISPAIEQQLQQAALRAVQNVPGTWAPGRQKGRPTAASFALNISCDPYSGVVAYFQHPPYQSMGTGIQVTVSASSAKSISNASRLYAYKPAAQ